MSNIDIYLSINLLPDRLRPVFVHREPDMVIIRVDPRDRRVDIAGAFLDQLSDEEGNAFRDGFGMPPRGTRLADDFFDGPCWLYVPPALRLPGDPAIQGGAELTRRRLAGQIGDELALLEAEHLLEQITG